MLGQSPVWTDHNSRRTDGGGPVTKGQGSGRQVLFHDLRVPAIEHYRLIISTAPAPLSLSPPAACVFVGFARAEANLSRREGLTCNERTAFHA